MPWFCPNCGTRLAYEDAKFCPDCGYSLIIESEQVEVANTETVFDTTYPLPDDVRNFVKPLRGSQINFQTGLGLEQVTAFYRRAFTERGLTEIESLTSIAEEFISLAFNGADGDGMVVLQAVDLAYGTVMDLRNVNLRTEEGSRADKRPPSIRCEVYVDDNFHYMDESERYKLGDFENCEEAVAACKKIVDEFLELGYTEGMSFRELYEGYTMFGEDPFIASDDDDGCRFSAWDYAKKRCREMCGGE